MEAKQKPCKGNYRVDKYEGCNIPHYNLTYGLCPSCFFAWMNETENGKIYYAKKFKVKVNKLKEKKAKIVKKSKANELTKWRPKLQTEIQKIARLIDIGQPCLARGYHSGQIHGGHVYAKGGNTTIALNLHNIHRQSAQSNKWQNDDGLLREGLVNEYGQQYMDFISNLRQCEAINYSNLEYMTFYRLACKISNELKKDGKTFNLNDRIKKRNEINLILSIYNKYSCIFTPS